LVRISTSILIDKISYQTLKACFTKYVYAGPDLSNSKIRGFFIKDSEYGWLLCMKKEGNKKEVLSMLRLLQWILR